MDKKETEKTEWLKSKPKKADKDKDNDKDNDKDKDNDLLLKEKEKKLQVRFIECLDYLKSLSFEVIDKVLSKTSGLQHPNWNYAKTILDDYVERKIDTLEKLEKLQEENSNNEQNEQVGEIKKLEGVWEEDD